jgi:sporulation protein YlmC with PRC-barrel domain
MSTVRELRGDDVAARDGVIGSVEDVYFDDERWAVRFLVVDTGAPGRRLLIAPQAVEPGLSGKRKVRLGLTLEQVESMKSEELEGAPSLCSGVKVIGYGIEARDGPIGEVQDFVVDDDTWAVRDIVVDTMKWWPGGLVRVHPEYVERIDRSGRKLHLRLTRDQVKLSGARSPRR